MELFILIIVLVILAETTVLVFQKSLPKKHGKRKIYVDTSVLIDGRIISIAKSGFLDGDLIVLKSVLRELQLLADGKDSERRMRARKGLDSVAELERVVEVNTEIYDDGEGRKKVDEELLKFARKNNGAVLTLDFNLIKVAEAENVKTLNINELSLAVRTEFLPGEKVMIRILNQGTVKGQGVGYLPDGTMVIVDKAAGLIGQEVRVVLVKFLENAAGKMIFAKIAKEKK